MVHRDEHCGLFPLSCLHSVAVEPGSIGAGCFKRKDVWKKGVRQMILVAGVTLEGYSSETLPGNML